MIHCYMFTKNATDPCAEVVQRAESILQCKLEEKEAYEVRDVSPKKLMICLSFPLPRAAFFRAEVRAAQHAHFPEGMCSRLFLAVPVTFPTRQRRSLEAASERRALMTPHLLTARLQSRTARPPRRPKYDGCPSLGLLYVDPPI